MNLWRKAPWRGTKSCEAPFRLVQFESYQCGSHAVRGVPLSRHPLGGKKNILLIRRVR